VPEALKLCIPACCCCPADDDACANNPCTGLAGSTGACADAAGSAQPPYTCTCITGRTWNSTTRTCDGEFLIKSSLNNRASLAPYLTATNRLSF
jgi:hypothetical protein